MKLKSISKFLAIGMLLMIIASILKITHTADKLAEILVAFAFLSFVMFIVLFILIKTRKV